MALNYTVGMLFQAKDMASEVMRRLEKQFGSLGDKAKSFVGTMAAAFASFKGAEAGVDALTGLFGMAERAGKFESALGELNATAGATRAEVMQFNDKALTMGLNSMFGPKAIAEGMTALVSAGMNAKDAIETVDSALMMATASAGRLTTTRIGEFLGNIKNNFPDAGSANNVVNMVAQLANISSVSFDKVPEMYSKVTRGSGALHQSLAVTSAALALFKNTTAGAEEAATSLGMSMLALAQPKKMHLFEEATGVTVLDRTKNQFRNFTDILSDMATSDRWNKLGLEMQNAMLVKVFESRQIGKIVGSLNQIIAKGFEDPITRVTYKGAEGIRRMVESFEKAAENNVAGRFFDEQINIFDGKMKLLQAKWETVTTVIGRAFGFAFAPFVSALDSALQQIGEVLNAIPAPLKNAAAVAFAGAIAIGTLTFALLAAVFAFKALALVAGVFGVTFGGVLAAAFPPLLIAIGIFVLLGAVVAAFVAAWQGGFGGLQSSTLGFINNIKLVLDVFKQLFAEGGTWGDVDKKLMDPKNSGVLNFVTTVWMWLGRIKNFAIGVWESFSEGIRGSGMIEAIMELVDVFFELFGFTKTSTSENINAWSKWAEIGREVGGIMLVVAKVGLGAIMVAMVAIMAVVAAFKAIWWTIGPLVMSVVQMVWGAIQALIGVVVGLFTLNFDMLGEGIMNVFKGVFSFILNFFGTFGRIVAGLIDGAAKLGGLKTTFRADVDAYLRSSDASVQAQTMIGTNQGTNPGVVAAQNQSAAVAASSPTITIKPADVNLHMESRKVASGVLQMKHEDDRRSYMSVAPAHAMVER